MSQGSSTSALNSNPAPLVDNSKAMTAAGTSIISMDVVEEPNCSTSIASATASLTVEPSKNGVSNSTKQWSKDVTEDGKFTNFSIDTLLRPSPMIERSGLLGNVARCVPVSLFPGFSFGPPVNPTFTDGTPWHSVSMNGVGRSVDSAVTSARGRFLPALIPMYSQAGSSLEGPCHWEVLTPGKKRKLDDKVTEILPSGSPSQLNPLKTLKRRPSVVSLTASMSTSTDSTGSNAETTELTSQPTVQSTRPHPQESKAENPLLQKVTVEMLQLTRIMEIISLDLAISKKKH